MESLTPLPSTELSPNSAQHSMAASKPKPTASTQRLRPITQSNRAHEMSEGIGSRVRRCIGNSTVHCLPPFVTCEYFRINDIGRPPHPARGAQKISVVISGTLAIEYSPTDVIELEAGDVTSLLVGRGVIRSMRAVAPRPQSDCEDEPGPTLSSKRLDIEVNPRPEAVAFQIFLDVPEPFKRVDSSHINLCHSDLVTFEFKQGVNVTIVTGTAFEHKAPQMLTVTPVTVLDCSVVPGANIEIPVTRDFNAFIYLIEGDAEVQGELKRKFDYVEFMRSKRRHAKRRPSKAKNTKKEESKADSRDDSGSVIVVSVASTASGKARFFFCEAEPLGQPIYRQGPFVDVSMDGIYQAFDDYTENKNGFESRRAWQKSPSGDSGILGSSETDSDVEPYNPCDDGPDPECGSNGEDESESSEEPGMNCKATFPNSFPPGKINPADHSTEFNNRESVEAQQERNVPKRPHESSDSEDERPKQKREEKEED